MHASFTILVTIIEQLYRSLFHRFFGSHILRHRSDIAQVFNLVMELSKSKISLAQHYQKISLAQHYQKAVLGNQSELHKGNLAPLMSDVFLARIMLGNIQQKSFPGA